MRVKRQAPHLAGEPVEIPALSTLDPPRARSLWGRPGEPGATEFDLLRYLMHHPNRAMTREQLLNALRGDHKGIGGPHGGTSMLRRLRTPGAIGEP